MSKHSNTVFYTGLILVGPLQEQYTEFSHTMHTLPLKLTYRTVV
jgi:hypothetical protein